MCRSPPVTAVVDDSTARYRRSIWIASDERPRASLRRCVWEAFEVAFAAESSCVPWLAVFPWVTFPHKDRRARSCTISSPSSLASSPIDPPPRAIHKWNLPRGRARPAAQGVRSVLQTATVRWREGLLASGDIRPQRGDANFTMMSTNGVAMATHIAIACSPDRERSFRNRDHHLKPVVLFQGTVDDSQLDAHRSPLRSNRPTGMNTTRVECYRLTDQMDRGRA